jgi:hypothetical protein
VNAEERLLVLLARGSLAAGTADRALALVRAGPSWPRFLALAGVHGVGALVSRTLEALALPGVPVEVSGSLAAARRLNAARNALIARGLAGVLGALARAGVPAIPLKGVVLAGSLYGDPAVRVCSDIDVLVPPGAVPRAFEAMREAGCVPDAEEQDVAPADLPMLLESNIEYAFALPSPPHCPVELHWGIAWRWPGAGTAVDDLWAEARPADWAGIPVRVMSPEWDLLYLSVHAARHRWQSLKWLADIHEVCARGLDWGAARDKAARLGWTDVLGITLGVTRRLFDSPVPDGMAGPVPPWLATFPAEVRGRGPWSDTLFPVRLFRGPGEKMRYLADLLLRPTLAERRLVRVPGSLAWLYYVLRPLRVGGRWGRSVVRPGA